MSRPHGPALVLAALSLLLGACADGFGRFGRSPVATILSVPAPLPPLGGEVPRFRQCVPFARYHSGVDLYGDAWTWWDKAAGQFGRGTAPRGGAVLVLKRTERLKRGHVAVVNRVIDQREITVDHANWSPAFDGPDLDMGVSDISARNDWSLVRFWNVEAATWGRPYPAYGFIYKEPAKTAMGY
jgi:surface antigen